MGGVYPCFDRCSTKGSSALFSRRVVPDHEVVMTLFRRSEEGGMHQEEMPADESTIRGVEQVLVPSLSPGAGFGGSILSRAGPSGMVHRDAAGGCPTPSAALEMTARQLIPGVDDHREGGRPEGASKVVGRPEADVEVYNLVHIAESDHVAAFGIQRDVFRGIEINAEPDLRTKIAFGI